MSANQDYCSFVPDSPFGFDFSTACERHDAGYTAGSGLTRSEADVRFWSDLSGICSTQYNDSLACYTTAGAYFVGVSLFGWLFYEGP